MTRFSSRLITFFFYLVLSLLSFLRQESLAAPTLNLVSARDHIEGSFTTQHSVYADADRIYLSSAQGTLFVLSRDRAANFPLIQTIHVGTPLSAVRGDSQYIFVSCGDGKLRVYRKDHPLLTPVATIQVASFRLDELGVVGDDIYVVAGATLAVNPDGQRFYVSPLNPGEFVTRIKIGTWQIAQTYPISFIQDTIQAIDIQTGQVVASVPGGGRGRTLYTNGTILTQTNPGCCGLGIAVRNASTLALQQVINQTVANAVTQYDKWLVGGDEAGRVLVFNSDENPSSQYGFIFLTQLTGHTNPEDIEIRSLWKDDHDDLIFAGSSWGNDQTRGPNLPSFFVLEFKDTSVSNLPLFKINAGGDRVGGFDGNPYQVDNRFQGGKTWRFPERSFINTEDPEVYKDVRYSTSEFSYFLPAPIGNYNLKLRFAEGDPGWLGQSSFSVSVNGSTVLNNFDIGTSAGGVYVALDKTFPVTVSNGSGVNVTFRNQSGGRAMVSALELSPGSAPTPTPTPTPQPTPLPQGVRRFGINSGAGVYTSPITGDVFLADTAFNGGGRTWTWTRNFTTIPGTREQPNLYTSVRFTHSNFSYNLGGEDGGYVVRLRFFEGDESFAGKSPFTVSINGIKVLEHFDVATQAGGPYKVIDKDFFVNARNGDGVTIKFTDETREGRAMVSAIELFKVN